MAYKIFELPPASVAHLNAQIPNPYQLNRWYPAQTITGGNVEIKKTRNNEYLHFRYRGTYALKNEDGTTERLPGAWYYFRVNLSTNKCREY